MKVLISDIMMLIVAVDMLAWSPDGSIYVLGTSDCIDVCSFEVCDVICYLVLLYRV